VGNAFDIDVEKDNHHKLDAPQNSRVKFKYDQACTLEPHLVFDLG
jgi:hypothetical protein